MKTFSTHDIYLATALKLSGFNFLKIEREINGKGLFIIEDKPERSQYVEDYFSGKLSGSYKSFVNTWRDLKALIWEMKVSER